MKDGTLDRVHDVCAPLRRGARQPGALLFCWFAGALIFATGCNVRVDKSEDGKNVKVATPFGSIAINKSRTSAAEVGLPPYPGASLENDGDGNDTAQIDMGFGSWKLRVHIAHYTTPDDRDQVLAFYRKALSDYGGGIECAGKRPVGTPTRTGEGLTCDDDADKHDASHSTFGADDIELKAGSPRHQHLVAIKSKGTKPTEFSLIALDLPHPDTEEHGTN